MRRIQLVLAPGTCHFFSLFSQGHTPRQAGRIRGRDAAGVQQIGSVRDTICVVAVRSAGCCGIHSLRPSFDFPLLCLFFVLSKPKRTNRHFLHWLNQGGSGGGVWTHVKKQQASYIRVSGPPPRCYSTLFTAQHLSRAQFSSSAVKHSNGGCGGVWCGKKDAVDGS